ncbi:MAG TPA: hypothetical protein VE844_17850 [Gammaproteobacteria bacterium]|jgi:hypothetical protein|nr:hypothetical protein [Actinomycetota bacterium]HZA17216.1 hypothetical protein [Pseudonocardiaceae bacterium]HZC03147.1 hypothetical protein [Gammaproteobacteria bacterium]
MSRELGAAASSKHVEEANLFNITGPIVIRYSRSSIAAMPQFSYKDAELDLSFSGDDITRRDAPLGEIVTVTLEDVPDAFVRSFTLLVPKMRLSMGDNVSFDTLGIETIDRSGAFVPPPGPTGTLQIYRSHQLQGSAEVVAF